MGRPDNLQNYNTVRVSPVMHPLPAPVSAFLQDPLEFYAWNFEPVSLADVRNIAAQARDATIAHYARAGKRVTPQIQSLFAEPLKNANFHGGRPDKHEITFHLHLAPEALVASFHDCGTYFMRPEIKAYWETKRPFPEKHAVEIEGIGYGAGTGIIYDTADLIHVDDGTLYVGARTSGIYFLK